MQKFTYFRYIFVKTPTDCGMLTVTREVKPFFTREVKPFFLCIRHLGNQRQSHNLNQRGDSFFSSSLLSFSSSSSLLLLRPLHHAKISKGWDLGGSNGQHRVGPPYPHAGYTPTHHQNQSCQSIHNFEEAIQSRLQKEGNEIWKRNFLTKLVFLLAKSGTPNPPLFFGRLTSSQATLVWPPRQGVGAHQL